MYGTSIILLTRKLLYKTLKYEKLKKAYTHGSIVNDKFYGSN